MAQVGPPGIWKEDGPWKLYVSVLSATNLPDPKNPYVKLVVTSQPNQERQTRKVNGGKTPGWYQEFEFDLDNSQRHLSVMIQDPRRIGAVSISFPFLFFPFCDFLCVCFLFIHSPC